MGNEAHSVTLECPECRRWGIASISDRKFFRSDRVRVIVDDVPEGFEIIRPLDSPNRKFDIICVACRVSALQSGSGEFDIAMNQGALRA